MASKDYTDERKAMMAKTARLKALRLAKEAEDLASAGAEPAKKAAAPRKAVKKKRMPAPWPWAATAPRKAGEA